MNSTQLNTTFASIVGIIAGFLAGRGVFGFDTPTWITILTALVGFGGTLWTVFVTRKTALVSTTSNMPEVKEVILDKTDPGARAMESVTPENVVAK